MTYTLGEAAKATGKSKAAISRAIKTHRISAERQDDGSFKIDPAELHRVYPPVNREGELIPATATAEKPVETRELQAKLEAAAARLADKDEVIHDLRHRLDTSEEERRRIQTQLTALLTDQRKQPEQPARRRWRWWK